ncbi:hypothetical protein [Chitinophaga barathri]|uniref:hypothetical protein n=1 Tax=Chitinophaga barathri TaxID=1647451 RepID=UPI000EA343F8|nr:hypothetical protein [Chitinophaga barathri]
MKIHILLYFLLITLLQFPASCNHCDGKDLGFYFVGGRKDDEFKIYINGILQKERKIETDFSNNLSQPPRPIFRYCSGKDSLKIGLALNNRDTIFYVHPKDIKDCYIGVDVLGYFVVYYNHEKGGLGPFSPVR